MGELYYLISDAAKQVQVETHVLRYWEDELHLPIKRNKQGHRFYTSDDVSKLKQIKRMKEEGYQLKAIRNALALDEKGEEYKNSSPMVIEVKEDSQQVSVEEDLSSHTKAARLQLLLRQMISEAVRESNKELGEEIKGSVLKELDYQFRLQEEREEEREKKRSVREEEHFKKLDELIREKATKGGKRKKHSIF